MEGGMPSAGGGLRSRVEENQSALLVRGRIDQECVAGITKKG
jgi:hypothetical protein